MNKKCPNYILRNIKNLKILLFIIFLIILLLIIEMNVYFIINSLVYYDVITTLITMIWHYFLLRKIIKILIFQGGNIFSKRASSLKLGLSTAKNFSKQIYEMKKVITEFKESPKEAIFSLSDLETKLFVITNAMHSVTSYLRMCNEMNLKNKISSYQKKLSFELHMLNLSVEESNLINFIISAIKRQQKGLCLEFRNNQLYIHIEKILTNINRVEMLLDECMLKKNFLNKIKNILFNDCFGSLNQLKIEMLSRFDCEEIIIVTKDKIKIDSLLLKPNYNNPNEYNKSKPNTRQNSKSHVRFNSVTSFKDKLNVIEENILESVESNEDNSSELSISTTNDYKNRSVMIICGPNASPYQIFAYSNKWIEYYLENGINVLLWNYRGFGDSSGTADFNNLNSDAEEVVTYLQKNYMFKKIGVHGISIGGIPVCHLAGKNLVNLCFADRTFSSIKDVIKNFGFGLIFNTLYNFFFFKKPENVVNYLNSDCFKIIASDPNDEIVSDLASLKVGIAKNILKEVMKMDIAENNLNSSDNSKSKPNSLLKLVLSDTERKEFFQSVEFLMKAIRLKFEAIPKGSDTNMIVKNLKEKKINYGKLPNDVSEINADKSEVQIEVVTGINQIKYEAKVFSSLKNIFEKFDSAGDNLLSINKYNNKKSKKIYLDNFFTNLLIWGSYKIGNEYATDKLIIYKAVVKKFNLVNQKIFKIINNQQGHTFENPQTTKSLKLILESLIKLESFFSQILFKNYKNFSPIEFVTTNSESGREKDLNTTNNLMNDNSIIIGTDAVNFSERYKSAELSDFIENLKIGCLIPLESGHNGTFTKKEIEVYSLYLMNSRFIC